MEPEFQNDDGTTRKTHYGSGKQPWDTIVELGWCVEFAAGNVLKYLRRDKDEEDSARKARWYYDRIGERADAGSQTAWVTRAALIRELTSVEMLRMRDAEDGA